MNPEKFDQSYRRQPELWKSRMQELCREQGLAAEPFEAFTAGSNLIAAVGDSRVVKLFPPWHRHQWASEWPVLRHLQGRLSVPTPELFGQGEWSDGWTWLIMSRLPGQMLEEYWPTMSLENKADIMLRLGHLMAEVKQLPIEGLTFQQPDWESFIKAQLAAYRARHERHKMPAWFLQDVDHFVQKHLHLLPKHLRPVLLTGEYTPFNMLAIRRAGEVALSGMIDFGDAMIGYAPYDLLGPSLFLGEGHPVLIDRLFQGYGERPDLRLLMLLQILHRYSHFRVQLRIPDWEQRAANMNDLQNLIWPLS